MFTAPLKAIGAQNFAVFRWIVTMLGKSGFVELFGGALPSLIGERLPPHRRLLSAQLQNHARNTSPRRLLRTAARRRVGGWAVGGGILRVRRFIAAIMQELRDREFAEREPAPEFLSWYVNALEKSPADFRIMRERQVASVAGGTPVIFAAAAAFTASSNQPGWARAISSSGGGVSNRVWGLSAMVANGPPIFVNLTDFTYECGAPATCEAVADDLRALIDIVNTAPIYAVEIAGLWELYAPSPQDDFVRWTLNFRNDGSYAFLDESNRASHSGTYHSNQGKWSLSGHWTNNPALPGGSAFEDGGAYRFIANDALEMQGRFGTGVWRKVAER